MNYKRKTLRNDVIVMPVTCVYSLFVVCTVYAFLWRLGKKETHPLEVFIYNIILSIVHS